MTVRKIVLIGDEILRKDARKVRKFDKELHRLLDDMAATMRDAPGVGLAAPQVGLSERVIVVELPEKEDDPLSNKLYEFVNPEIVFASDEEVEAEEGCLSIPNLVGDVWRSQRVTVKGQDRYGKNQKIEAKDWLARVFQHEIDHINGVLFIDRVEGPHKLHQLIEIVDQENQTRLIAVPFKSSYTL